jgi:hypothetical protein
MRAIISALLLMFTVHGTAWGFEYTDPLLEDQDEIFPDASQKFTFTMCNDTSQWVNVAIIRKFWVDALVIEVDYWVVEGWHPVGPRSCRSVTVRRDGLWAYAIGANGREYQGNAVFQCVPIWRVGGPNPPFRQNAEGRSCDPGYERSVGFYKMNINPGASSHRFNIDQ